MTEKKFFDEIGVEKVRDDLYDVYNKRPDAIYDVEGWIENIARKLYQQTEYVKKLEKENQELNKHECPGEFALEDKMFEKP